MREARSSQIRARMRNIPTTDKCVACGASCPPTCKFCPECGTPRVRVSKTFDDSDVGAASRGACCRCRSPGASDELAALIAHMRRPAGQANVGLLVIGNEGAGRSALLRQASTRRSQTTAASSTRSVPIRAASRRRTIRSARCSRRCCSCRRCRREVELRDAVLAHRPQRARRARHRAAVRPPDVAARARAAGPPPRDGVVGAARARARRLARAGRRSCARTSTASITRASRSCAARPRPTELQLPPIVMTANDRRSASSGRRACRASRSARSRRRTSTRSSSAARRLGRARPADGAAAVRDHARVSRARRARRPLPARGRQGRGHRDLAARP